MTEKEIALVRTASKRLPQYRFIRIIEETTGVGRPARISRRKFISNWSGYLQVADPAGYQFQKTAVRLLIAIYRSLKDRRDMAAANRASSAREIARELAG